MARVNNALLPKEGEETSRPWQWPINYKVCVLVMPNLLLMFT